jgi:hypothetical protein
MRFSTTIVLALAVPLLASAIPVKRDSSVDNADNILVFRSSLYTVMSPPFSDAR